MRSRIEPMKKIARMLRAHRDLILNYFKAQKQFSSGVVEGLNNKAKVTMRKSYGFRTFRRLAPGKHRVRLSLGEHHDWEKIVWIGSGSTAKVVAKLDPLRIEGQERQHWRHGGATWRQKSTKIAVAVPAALLFVVIVTAGIWWWNGQGKHGNEGQEV